MTTISDIHELVAAVDIADFVVHEERARRIQWSEGSAPSEPLNTTRLGVRVDGANIGYRFRVVFADSQAEYVADIEVVYEVSVEAPDIDDELIKDFAERVAFMAVYPFIRTTIFAAAGRLGMPAPVMGIVRQGDFSTGEPMSEEEIRGEFFDNQSELAPSKD